MVGSQLLLKLNMRWISSDLVREVSVTTEATGLVEKPVSILVLSVTLIMFLERVLTKCTI